jgi:hypothetical protein
MNGGVVTLEVRISIEMRINPVGRLSHTRYLSYSPAFS